MSTTTAAPPDAAPEEKKGGGKKKIIMLLVVVLIAFGGVYWFMLKPSDAAEPVREPGEVLTLEPIQINLADGHYLRVGIALQLAADLAHGADGSKALDATIDLFSGAEKDELVNPKVRKEYKEKLMKVLEHDYHGDVLEVFFTEFVTQ